MSLVTRFAPSPTGHLHLGSAYAALVAWTTARAAGGTFLVRMEDIDTQRCRPAYADSILEDLAWLGIDWDGEVRVQTQHLDDYRNAVETLKARGLIYPCFCSRADILAAGSAAHGPEGPVYPGICRKLSSHDRDRRMATEPHAWRLDMAAALSTTPEPLHMREHGVTRRCDPARFGDVVLERRDMPGSYHLCVTHDDWVQGVTLVTRGEDLLATTDLHRLVQAVMGWAPPDYAHHSLLRDINGERLAKRSEAASIHGLRAAGATPVGVRALAGFG